MSAITSVDIEIGGSNISMTNLGNGSYSYSLWVPSSVGLNSYTVYATDSEGNIGSLSGDITVEDTTDPTVDNPWESADPLELGATETIQVDVSDLSSITTVEIEIAGSNISMTNLGNGSYSYNAWTPAGVGVKSYTVYATDNEGNVGSLSGDITVVDTTGPTVDNLWELADPLELGATETIQVDVSDLSTITTVEIEIAGSNMSMTDLGNGSYSYNLWTPVGVGVRFYTVYATDNESNIGSLSSSITVVDTTGPTVDNPWESADPLELGTTETIQVDVTDLSTITTVEIEIAGVNNTMTDLGNGSYSYNSWVPSTVGLNSYIVYATDNESNIGSLAGSINVEDTTNPTVDNPRESADPLELGAIETIQVDVTDLSAITTVEIEIASMNYSMTDLGNGSYSYNVWVPSSTGLKSYTVYATDNEGNVGTLSGDIIVEDTTDPTWDTLVESADPLPLGQNETIQINAYDSPGSGIASVILEYKSANHTMNFIGGDMWEWTLWQPSTAMTYSYVIYITDNSGNSVQTSGNIMVEASAGPTLENVTKTSPLELGDTAIIEIDAFDNDTVDEVWIMINSVNYTMTNIIGNTWQYNAWTPTSIGSKSFRIYANDSFGNENQFNDLISVVDTTEPDYSNYYENASTIELGESVLISIDVTDLGGISQVILEFLSSNNTMTDMGNDSWQYTLNPSSAGVAAFTIYMEDNSGNINTTSDSMNVQDTTDPTVNNPWESADPLELGATETIQVDVSDLSAITTVEIEIASTNYSMTNLGNGSYSYSTWVPSLVGSNSYTVYATDSEGNVGTLSGDITVEDTTDPTVNNPWESADPLELGTTETIQVDVSDVSAITSVDIEIGGSNISMTNLGNGSFSYNAWTPLGVGVKPYTVYATDNEGNIGSLSGNITVVDTTGPTVDNLWESADPLELGATETIQVDVTDLSPLSTVEIEIGGANNTMTNLGNGSYSYNAWIPNTIGLKAYTVYATDNESNVGTLGGTIDIQDTTGPIVENITESADPLELGATETIQVDVSDFSIITSVDIEIGGSNISMTNLGNGSYSYNLWTPGSVGIKSYTIYATDSEGNVGSLSGDITVEDTTAPALSGLSESASTIEIGLTETVDIDVTDLSTIDTVWLDIGGTNYTMTLLFGFTYRNNSWITDTLGLNAYTIYANDSEGNVNSLTDNITVIDTTDPTVQNIIESADPLPLGSTETIQVDASDLSGIVSVEIEFGGSNHSMTDLGNGSYVYNTWVPSTIGSKPYTIHATDNGGNVGMGSGSILVVDTGAPTVENLTESADPLELGAIETIQVDVYDSTGISTVEIEIGSTNYSMTDLGNGSYSYAWTPSSAGTIVYTIYATDTTSNVGTLSDDITVEDTTLPLVENITVSAGPIELGLTVIIDVDVWDLSGIDTVLLEHGGVNYTMTWVILNQYRNNTWVTTVTGVNAYTIHVNDTEGNVNSVSSDLTVQDTTDPILENLTESASTLELGDKETIRVDAWDLSGIASVLIEIAGINYSMTDLGNGTYENSTWMPSTVGLKTYMIYAEDNNGNIQILSDSINVVDTTNPTIENVTESADPLELGLGEMIAADAADLTGITSMQIEIGAANTSMADLGNGTYTYLWTPTSVGLTPYTIYATDGEGNVNSHWSNITVQDTTGPTIENVSESADPLFISLNETIQVDIWDLSSLDVLQIDINGSVNPLSLVSGNTYMYTWTPGGVGLYVYNITANDTEGNLNWLSGDITVIDSIPLFENITESGDPVELGSNITITVDITDILGISAVWIDINSSLVNLTNPVNDTWSVSWQPGSIGLYIYTIYAENNGNYSSSIGGNFTVQDTTGPAFVAINLNSNTINVGKVLVLSIEVFDVSGVQYVLVEINSISYNLTSNVSSLYVFNIWSSATTGDYQYIITTMDILNNSNSFTGYFKVVINNDGAGDGDADFDLQDFIDRLMDPTAIIYFAISLIAVIGGILIKTRRKVHGRDWDKR
ncbi:MAG: beta strand repeat-containing protein [Candidatus Hodarchaeota archaeon]